MGDDVSFGYLEDNKYHGIHIHSCTLNTIHHVGFVAILNGYNHFKELVNKYGGGFSNIATIRDFLGGNAIDNFYTGIDYSKREDPRIVDFRVEDSDFVYAVTPELIIKAYEYGELKQEFDAKTLYHKYI